MSILSSQVDELRMIASELREVYGYNFDWTHEEAVTLASSVDCMREAADTIESLRDRLQEVSDQACHATQPNYEHCKYNTDRGWRDTSRYSELFGTPEKAAETLQPDDMSCKYCLLKEYCKDKVCLIEDYDALLEWLKGTDA